MSAQELDINSQSIKDLLEGIPDPLLIHKLGSDQSPGQIVLCNQKALELTGYSRDELLTMSITDLGHPVSGLKDVTITNDLKSGNPILFERLIVRKDKTSFPVEVNGQLIEYQGEKMVLSLLRDISERKKAEEENHLHLMFEKIVSNISSRFVNMPDHQIDNGIEKTLKEVCEFIGAIRGGIFLLTSDKKGLSISHEWCSDEKLCQKPLIQNFPIEGFNYNSTQLQKLEDVILDKIDELPDKAQGEREWYKKHGFNPIFFVPIISEDQLVGAMGFSAEDSRNHRWPRQFSYLFRYIASIFYSAINRKEISWKFRRTQFTIDHYSDAVFWLSTPEFKVIDVNAAACNSLGYTREEMLRMTVYDFDSHFPRENLDGLWKALKKKGSNTIESIHQKKDGEQFPVEILANLIEFEGNEYIVSFSRDISARKEAEKQLQQSEQEYRKIFENVAHVFYEASLDGKLLNVTPSVERLTKYRQKDLIGKSMEIFYYDPSIRDSLLKSLYEKGEILDFELDVKDMDGSPVPASLNSRIIFDKDGTPERIVGSISDRRKRRKAEAQVRQLSTALEQSPVSVIITDPDTRILYVNKCFAQFSDMPPEEIVGSTPFEITQGQIPLNTYNDLWDSVKEGKVWKGEIEYKKRDDSNVWLSITVSPVLDDQNRSSNFVAILEEITERKAAEQNLRKAKEQAEKSDHLKSAFLANMSHEIRTPMNAILGFSSLLKENDLDPEQSEYYIDIINSKGRDLLRIISDIIDISRIEAGDLYMKMEPVEIFPFVRDVFNEFKEDTQVKSRSNLQFRLKLPDPEKKIIVNTDPARLKQILVNLIQNALKFTPDGFVEIGFNLLDMNNIRFFVNDSGIGIPEDKKKIIFERFRQIDDSHTREYGGTGLGLAISTNLLDLMGSELSLKSVKGQGSEFSFGMKYILTEAPDAKTDQDDSKLPKIKLDLQGKTILIVEDDGSSYLFLETFLKRFAPEIIWAKSGKQALDIMNTNRRIDLILMDIRMPEMDGLSATRHIRKTNKKIPIIAQTAYAQVTDRKLALESGCSDYISKPVSPVELTNLLEKYLNPAP
ncbi:PAS domain S-box protein [Bacteroidota bacterium]